MSIDDLKSLMDAFEPSALLPELDSLMGIVVTAVRVAMLVGPVILLVMGILYLFLAPKEANYYFGYRCFFGMGSVEAWRYTQRIAGLVWAALGLILTVTMFVVSGGFAQKQVQEVLSSAMTCILWEVGLVAVSCLAINTLVMMNFTADGELRKRNVKK
jgi:uncharacterized membrane protein